jgi:hypothetical protein
MPRDRIALKKPNLHREMHPPLQMGEIDPVEESEEKQIHPGDLNPVLRGEKTDSKSL